MSPHCTAPDIHSLLEGPEAVARGGELAIHGLRCSAGGHSGCGGHMGWSEVHVTDPEWSFSSGILQAALVDYKHLS